MRNYLIESFKITKLWGYRDIDLTFNNDVNILIGPNGSGKTTILNLLHSILSADLRSVLKVNFEQANIRLRGFKGRAVRTLTVKVDPANRVLKITVGKKEHKIDIDTLSTPRIRQSSLFYERDNTVTEMIQEEIYDELTTLVPLVWLPVSRHLPVKESEEERYTRRVALESVDLRLKKLLEDFPRYHLGLNAQLSERYKKFENQVLSMILYSKEHDKFDSISFSLPTETEKEQLLRAFEASGLSRQEMRGRINDHFAAAADVMKRTLKGKSAHLELEDFFILPLIGRTQTMVKYAGKLEEDREQIFSLLRLYEKTVSSFLNDKSVEVDGSGELKIELSSLSPPLELDWRLLSSGEKQILILLTEALFTVNKPIVYIADEPELSLHVSWQEKLLESLVTLGGQIQVIVATHSPDIVGEFHDKVIDLGRES